jgi:isopenicillin N synthase-like dioxygenase
MDQRPLVSTLHRVLNPPAAQRGESRRQSLVSFHNPNAETVIDCLETCCGPDNPPRYPAVQAGEYLAAKSGQAYGSQPRI